MENILEKPAPTQRSRRLGSVRKKKTFEERVREGLIGIGIEYAFAESPSAGWKAAWKYSSHGSRGPIRRYLTVEIFRLARIHGVGDTWPDPDPIDMESLEKAVARAFEKIGIDV